jgi:alpha-glucosidase
MNTKYIIFLSYLSLLSFSTFAQTYLLQSPEKITEFHISIGSKIEYGIRYSGVKVIENSMFGLQFSQSRYFGNDLRVVDIKEVTINERWEPVVGSYNEVVNHCNEMTMTIQEQEFPARKIKLAIRAYDDGIAFRYYIPESWERFLPTYENTGSLTLLDELTEFDFSSNHLVWAADYRSYATHQEEEFNSMFLDEISGQQVIGLPFLVKVNDHCFAAIAEADLTDWAGMYLKKENQNKPFSLTSDLSPLPDNPREKVKVTPGSWSPWRVVILGESPGDLIESEIINNLNDPCEIEDPSWIVPGISAWDHWWSGEVKMDTETLRDYIRLAADMGWEYMLVDWHWYGAPFLTNGEFRADPNADITTVNPAVNMQEVRAYAKQKNVKLILWLLWDHVDRQMDEAFALYESWGISGVKIDFMARDDQEMVNWYHKVVKKAAEHKLVVDFHGAYKPTGWSRTYPNLLTREGVLGNEYSKWSSRITPEHNVTLPYTRMLAGHMDYTPGGFLNATAESFRNGAPAQVMTTRAHQLAMFVVYYSPYTVACDHPANYAGQPGIEFLKEVPTIWDDTKFISGEVGEYIVMARKKDDRWFLGGMNNSEQRDLNIHLDFLQEGKYKIHYFKDSPDSNVKPADISIGVDTVQGGQYFQVRMEKGGGFAAFIELK